MINRTLARAGMALAAVAILAAGYFGFIWARDTFFTSEVVESTDPGGFIFASLGTLSLTSDDGEEGAGVFPVIFDVEENDIIQPALDVIGSTSTSAFHYSYSPSSAHAVFLAKDFSVESDPIFVDNYTVYRTNISGVETGEDMTNAWRNAEAVSLPDSEDYFRDVPVIDDRGRVLYSSLSEENLFLAETPDQLSLEAWNIYLIDETGEKTYITNGAKPHFLGEEHIVFIRSNGIYMRGLGDVEDTLIYEHTSGVTFLSSLDVAFDQQHIAFTDPYTSQVMVFDANPEGATASLAKTIHLAATFAVFSPDMNYLALMLLEPYTRIGFYSPTEDSLVGQEIDLSDESIEAVYLNSWR